MMSGVSMSCADRHEHLDGIVADVGVHRRTGGQRAAGRDEDGVAVGIGGRHELGADAAARAAALILDDDALAKHCAKPVCDDARHAVGRPTGRERHDHLDRPVRIGLRLGVCGTDAMQRTTDTQPCCYQGSYHLHPSRSPVGLGSAFDAVATLSHFSILTSMNLGELARRHRDRLGV